MTADRNASSRQRLGVDPATVVGELDVHAAALVEGTDPQETDGWLAGGDPFGRHLDPVVDGVAHEVEEGVAQGFVHSLVDSDVFALDLDDDLLAQSSLPGLGRPGGTCR